MVTPSLVRAIRARYALPWFGAHGVGHWARVLENGRRLATATGARVRVVELFSVFHDARRVNEHRDPGHGDRGGELAALWVGKHFHLPPDDLDLLVTACRLHTDGLTEGDVTLLTCWDADRLDLGRVGIRPDPRYLCTDVARDPEVLAWAYRRSVNDFLPRVVGEEWKAAGEG